MHFNTQTNAGILEGKFLLPSEEHLKHDTQMSNWHKMSTCRLRYEIIVPSGNILPVEALLLMSNLISHCSHTDCRVDIKSRDIQQVHLLDCC